MSDNQPLPSRLPIADDISIHDLIARYESGPALLRATVADMSSDHQHARPIADKMTTHEVVTHIVDSEHGLGGRLKRAIAGEEPIVATGAHPEIVSDPTRDLATELDTLDAARAQMAEQLRQVPSDVWDRVALRRGEREMTVRQVLALMTRHLENHVAAIEEKRAALGL